MIVVGTTGAAIGPSKILNVDGFGLLPPSHAILVLRRAVAGHSIAALAADFIWGPLTRTPPYRERIADPQRPGRVDSTATQLAGTTVRIIPDASVFDPGRNSTIRRGCRDGTDRQVECRLSVRRADDTVLTIATLTFVKDDDDDLLVSAITLT